MILIIDYGIGNPGSIRNMLKKIGVEAVISSNIPDIEKADKLILPGVGAFDNGMKNLRERGLIPALNDKVINQKIPILGICLGMQLLTNKSEEGKLEGLGLIDAETVKFRFNAANDNLRIPHMGWNQIKSIKKSPLVNGVEENSRFYFVHSYHVVCRNNEDILAIANYGYDFVAAVNRDNIFGVQFHPEKSHKFGMQILKNFAELY